MKSSGFTFIELLIVVLVVGFLFSIVLPFSQERYQRYKGAIEAEKVLLFLSKKRQEAFLYGEEIEISSKEGILFTSKGESLKIDQAFIEVRTPFKFYPAGTTNGGLVYFYYGKAVWIIEVYPPFSNLYLKEYEGE
ncbi:MAG: type II secretion system GspH family protein [Thermodesulfobacteriaceae bacterium]|nr:type II secretion system GspH family protein [Candidatus Aenigmarchaeota archaeon]MCX8042426.1 type II secretion system GspH family protein [Thermodesulfobacteriaceae bacterium]